MKAPDSTHAIYFWRLTPPLHQITVTDASGANKRSDYSMEGIALPVSEDRVGEPKTDDKDFFEREQVSKLGGKCHLMLGTASKSKRISHSTSHAETLAAARGLPMGQLLSIRYSEADLVRVNRGRITPMRFLQLQDDGHVPIPTDLMIDCMDCWELCTGYRGVPQDKSQRLAILALREERKRLRLRRLYHVRARWMLSDMLTKFIGCDSWSLAQLMTCGRWAIQDQLGVRTGFGSPPPSASSSTRPEYKRGDDGL